MPAISLVTVNTIARTAITATSICTTINVQEDGSVIGYPTTDLLISFTLAGPQRRIPLGSSYPFHKKSGIFAVGDIAGYVQAVKGSTTLAQDEQGVT